jgi:hypothetical protein
VITGGLASTTALAGSTEADQFGEKKTAMRAEHGPDASDQPIRVNCPQMPIPIDLGQEEMLLPSGD